MSLFSRMDSLTLGTANSFSALQFFSQPSIHGRSSKVLTFPSRKLRSNLVLASKDEPKLDEWDQMELKFGRMIGEDPKITLAKIMGRKSNPDLSYLEIEKLLDKRKGKASGEEIEDIPFDLSSETKSEISTQELNLVRPVPKKGIKFVAADKPLEADVDTSSQPQSVPDEKRLTSTEGLRLLRPIPKKGINFEATNKMAEVYGENAARPLKKATEETKSSVPNVILRKPSLFNEDNGGENRNKTSRFGMKPNLSLRMGKDMQKERFSDITLLKKPEPVTIRDEEKTHSDSSFEIGEEDKVVTFNKEGEQASSKELTASNFDQVVTEDKFGISKIETASGSNANQFQETGQIDSEVDKGFAGELQADMSSGEETFATDGSSGNINSIPIGSVLQEKPKRLDHPGKAADLKIQKEVVLNNPESVVNLSELETFLKTSPVKEQEEDYWTRAEKLVKTGEREEVELISSSSRGFVVSFGSLIGFLPYRNLGTRWKFLAFESWLRRKGLDPANYRQNLGIIGKYEASSMSYTTEPLVDPESDPKTDKEITPDMKPEDLLMIYDQEKLKFLSSFIGQKIKVSVALADRNSRRIIVSIKPKEKEELTKKKRSLMARLSVGDVVKCCIKKITYFGVFVEVEGVPALIHQTEVSWDATLDPVLHFKVGQIVDAKVHQLDFSLDRIYLSLKEITPDPLMETLEAVVGGHNSLDGRLEVAEADTEWPDVESLIKELQQFDGIQSVSKGWYFLSPGLAPTFQVYMASLFENQYKLLARAGNRVQEVIVQTSLSKDELKSAIMMCTNRVG